MHALLKVVFQNGRRAFNKSLRKGSNEAKYVRGFGRSTNRSLLQFESARKHSISHETIHSIPLEMRSLFAPLVELHRKVSSCPPAASDCLDWATIHSIVSVVTNTEIAAEIVQCLQHYSRSATDSIRSLRASMVYSFADEDKSWLVVEWKQDVDTNVIAVFDFDDFDHDRKPCSWLMHYSHHASISPLGNQKYEIQSSVAWMVVDLENLKGLLQAAQHILGILTWPKRDAMRLYCETDPSTCSSDEFVCFLLHLLMRLCRLKKYASLLVNHFRQIEQLNVLFNKVFPLIETMCSRQGKHLLEI